MREDESQELIGRYLSEYSNGFKDRMIVGGEDH